MLKFAIRHFTAILIVLAVAGWAIFYLPGTPSWAVVRMKQAIDARDGNGAAEYVDFESVVKHAGYKLVEKRDGGGMLGEFIGKAAVDLFVKPMAQMVQAWAVSRVNDGDPDVQMPAAAVAGSIVSLHRNGGTAFTKFKDHKGQEWEIHLAREADGRWRVTEVGDIEQLIEQLQRDAQKRLEMR